MGQNERRSDKMISKDPVKLQIDDGSEVESRIMITCRLSEKKQPHEEVEVQVRKDNLYTNANKAALTTDYLAIDLYEEEAKELEVIPEHFDTQVYSEASQEDTFEVKKNEIVRFSQSVTTKSLHTPDGKSFLEVNKYFSKNTTLPLLCCKTKNWNVMKALLELDHEKYPTLFSQDRDKCKCSKSICLCKHHLYFQDDSKANCLHLALEDGQKEICEMIIERVDVHTLKTVPIEGTKHALAYIKEMERTGNDFPGLGQLRTLVEQKIAKKK